MLFNFIKTAILTISRRKKSLHHPELVLDCSTPQEVDQHCHVGVVFNKSPTWDSHIDYICRKSNTTLKVMKRLKNSLPREALEKLFTCRIRPIIEYGNYL